MRLSLFINNCPDNKAYKGKPPGASLPSHSILRRWPQSAFPLRNELARKVDDGVVADPVVCGAASASSDQFSGRYKPENSIWRNAEYPCSATDGDFGRHA